MGYYSNCLEKTTEIDAIRREIIAALNDVGVAAPANAKLDDLPELIMSIGGTDLRDWPVNMNAIGYNAEDSRFASYRFLAWTIDKSTHWYDPSLQEECRKCIDLPTAIQKIKSGVATSKTLYDSWNPATTNADALFANKPGLYFPPKIDTSNVTSMVMFYYNSHDLVYLPKLDTSNVLDMRGFIQNCELQASEIPDYDLSSCTNMEGFAYSTNTSRTYLWRFKNLHPTDIRNDLVDRSHEDIWWRPAAGQIFTEPIDCTGTMTSNMFNENANILSLQGFIGLTDSDLNLGSCENLTLKSVMNIFENLGTVSETRTITLHPNVYDQLTASMIQVATDKGWTIERKD